ncbi:MAG: DUF333 domain-containing protein [Pseudomonadota bacterium]
MNQTNIIVIAVIAIAVIVAGYFVLGTGDAPTLATSEENTPTVGAAVTDVGAKAKTFCESNGGTITSVTAAEGAVMLCNLPDGSSVEATQYMISNRTE